MSQTADFERSVAKSIEAALAVQQSLLRDNSLIRSIARVGEILLAALRSGNKLLLFGNGGSAADAQHIAAEFVGRFAFDRPALPALALSDAPCLTAIGNDYGFEQVFSRQIEALARAGDIGIGLSTSGNSPNVSPGHLGRQKNGLTHRRFYRRIWRQTSTSPRCRSLHLCSVERHSSHSGMSYSDRSHCF